MRRVRAGGQDTSEKSCPCKISRRVGGVINMSGGVITQFVKVGVGGRGITIQAHAR